MSVLDAILETKRQEVAALYQARKSFNISSRRTIRSLRTALLNAARLGVIAEIKRKSPSKGMIQTAVDPSVRARVYERAGATAISVLTDKDYFHGSLADLQAVRTAVSIPVLRKDFIIDEIQVDEAYDAGADAVLLIAAALPARRLSELSGYAQRLGLDVLLEVHGVGELDAAIAATPSVIGVNNRNLHTFEVDLSTTEAVLSAVPEGFVVISESGIFSPQDAQRMAAAGTKGVLVGEYLMRRADLSDVSKAVSELQVERLAVEPR